MTRAGALSQSRMRQRKLNTRASLQIIREDDLHEADDDLPRVLSGLDSGVEKAEQNVGFPPMINNQTRDQQNRNTIYKLPSRLHKQPSSAVRSLKYSFLLRMLCKAPCSMTSSTLSRTPSRRHTFAFLLP